MKRSRAEHANRYDFAKKSRIDDLMQESVDPKWGAKMTKHQEHQVEMLGKAENLHHQVLGVSEMGELRLKTVVETYRYLESLHERRTIKYIGMTFPKNYYVWEMKFQKTMNEIFHQLKKDVRSFTKDEIVNAESVLVMIEEIVNQNESSYSQAKFAIEKLSSRMYQVFLFGKGFWWSDNDNFIASAQDKKLWDQFLNTTKTIQKWMNHFHILHPTYEASCILF